MGGGRGEGEKGEREWEKREGRMGREGVSWEREGVGVREEVGEGGSEGGLGLGLGPYMIW